MDMHRALRLALFTGAIMTGGIGVAAAQSTAVLPLDTTCVNTRNPADSTMRANVPRADTARPQSRMRSDTTCLRKGMGGMGNRSTDSLNGMWGQDSTCAAWVSAPGDTLMRDSTRSGSRKNGARDSLATRDKRYQDCLRQHGRTVPPAGMRNAPPDSAMKRDSMPRKP